MANDIIDCGGVYEVHPATGGGWAVVNGETGIVRHEFGERHEAVDCATELNETIRLERRVAEFNRTA